VIASRHRCCRERTLLLLALTSSMVACQRQPVRLDAGAPIVLVVIDTLRADALGVYGAEQATSPALDAWAERGAIFDRAFSTAPWTLPSVGSLLTGRFPSGHGSGRGKLPVADDRTRRVFLALDASVPRLAGIVSQHGYATAAFVTNTFLRPGFGLAEGFDTYDHTRNRYLDERRADVMVGRALEWIDQRPQREPWFLLLHLLDPHQPYNPPPAEAGRFTSGYQGPLRAPIGPAGLGRGARRGQADLDAADRAFLRGVYDEEVAFVAAQIARLLDGLAARQVLERGLVIVTADHGEEFFDHGGLEHGHTFYQELLHVPLLIWGPHVRAARHREPVSQVDVLPTILDALGVAPPADLDGVSLWPLLTGRGKLAGGRELVAENSLYGDQRRAIVEWPYKLVIDVERPDVALYDLERDPAERENLAVERPEVAERLTAALARRAPRELDAEAVVLDADTKRELRALGYLR
jgi:arylsulfatase A-like enzyme